MPQRVPLLRQREELGEGLVVAIAKHVHTDALLVRVPVAGDIRVWAGALDLRGVFPSSENQHSKQAFLHVKRSLWQIKQLQFNEGSWHLPSIVMLIQSHY